MVNLAIIAEEIVIMSMRTGGMGMMIAEAGEMAQLGEDTTGAVGGSL